MWFYATAQAVVSLYFTLAWLRVQAGLKLHPSNWVCAAALRTAASTGDARHAASRMMQEPQQ